MNFQTADQKQERKKAILNKFSTGLAEFLGTTILVFISCMGCTAGMKNILDTPWTSGLAVLSAIQIFGHVSGAHINPAVTIAAYIMEQIEFKSLPIYIIPQVAGSVTGYALLMAVTPVSKLNVPENIIGNCVNFAPNLTGMQATFVELMLTVILVFAICSTWDPKNQSQLDSMALRIGFIVVVLNLAGANYTGASMNPCRSFGPALLNWNFDMHYVYWIGPILGGIIASYTYKLIFLTQL